ncbi:MAG: hypothetical protein ACFBSE_21100 [Prochloraceae cyanobacterium]
MVDTAGDYTLASILVLGVFLGSASWWLILGSAVNFFGQKLDSVKLSLINKISGIIIISFGLAALLSLKN